MNSTQRFDAARSFDAAQYQQNASFVPALGDVILGWLNPQPGERILDPSCGTGGFLITGMNHALEFIEPRSAGRVGRA